MIKCKKIVNYKVRCLVELYSFDIRFVILGGVIWTYIYAFTIFFFI
jgi:hypothetical protein